MQNQKSQWKKYVQLVKSIQYVLKLCQKNNLCGKKANNFQIYKMSIASNEALDHSNQNGIVSKREQKKFEQMLKMIEATENQDQKSHKRRKHTHDQKSDPSARKMIKTDDSKISDNKQKEGSSSVKQVSEQDSRVQQVLVKRQIHDLHDVYNKKYGISQETESISQYMVNYTYGQKSKLYEKECEDWTKIENLSGKKLEIKSSSLDQDIINTINKKFSLQKEKVQDIFSKNSKQFFKKLMIETFPKLKE